MIAEASRAIIQQAQLLSAAQQMVATPHRRSMIMHKEAVNARDIQLIAEPFYISGEAATLIEQAAHSVPAWPIRPEDFLVDCGFMWFAKPLTVRAPHPRGSTVDLLAMSFCRARLSKEGEPLTPGVVRMPPGNYGNAVVVLWWFDHLDRVADGAESPGLFRAQWYYGRDLPLHHDTVTEQAASLQAWHTAIVAIFRSAISFMQQRIMARHQATTDRAGRKLAVAAGLEPKPVTVITLRRRSSVPTETPTDHEAIDWSCRWWVAGHWRQQPCGEDLRERRPVWITPYIKGPEDKPVKTARRLFAVVR